VRLEARTTAMPLSFHHPRQFFTGCCAEMATRCAWVPSVRSAPLEIVERFREILAGSVKQKERSWRALDLFSRVGDLLEYLTGFAFTRRARPQDVVGVASLRAMFAGPAPLPLGGIQPGHHGVGLSPVSNS
jgi:hypothetical protein